MNRGWVLTLSIIILFLSGCVQAGSFRGPQGLESAESFPANGSRPILASAEELADKPDQFDGHLVQLSGNLAPDTVQGCEGKVYHWPATWRLNQEEAEVAAAVPEDMRAAFARSDQIYTVEGYWQRWPGFAGCGRSQPQPSPWYLQVVRVVGPNSVAFVPTKMLGQFVPFGVQGTAVAGTSAAVALLPEEAAAPPTPAAPQPVIPTATSIESGETATPRPGTAFPSPTTSIEPSPSATLNLTPGVATATPTGTATGTATPNPRFSPTPTLAGPETITQPELEKESIETGNLGPGDTHLWPYPNDGAHTLRLQVAVEDDLVISARILDPNGQLRETASNPGPGELLVLSGISLPNSGSYLIEVRSENESAGNYAILALDETSYDFEFQGLIEIGQSGSGQFEAETDHFWHFSGTAGQSITIRVDPVGDEDLFLRLFDTEGKSLVSQHNVTGNGQIETLTLSTLPATGLYSLLIGEFDFGPASYTVELE